ncbi:DUF554 domain-containing protein [Marinilabiliaceae bacterium ANBcel2]|nr:DUF554 domain-containing protein [Marinilabiliaceae bacterium ANBcel2]
MTGTLVNVAAIIVGGVIGLTFKKNLPEKIVKVVFQGVGLLTVCIGVSMFLKTENLILVVLSILFGGIVGGSLQIDKRIQYFSLKLRKKSSLVGETFSEGITTAFLLYCMGALAILGAIDEGLGHGSELLLTKSVLDGFSSIALASALGVGVIFSIVPLFLYQGGITLMASHMGAFINESIINDLSATGGILLCGLGLNILKVTKIKVIDLIPSLLFILIFAYIYIWLIN